MRVAPMLLLAIASLTACSGVGADPAPTFTTDATPDTASSNVPAFPLVLTADAELLTYTMKAVEAWNEAAGRTVFALGFGGIRVHLMQRVHSVETGDVICGSVTHGDVRLTRDQAIRSKGGCGGYQSVVTHELGHLLGIQHTEYGLMGEDGSNVTVIDGPAYIGLCQLHGCASKY